MSAIVFVGPTIDAGEAASILDAVYLPPVAHGDVYRAVESRPDAIGIIDGYFGHVRSVWHKEILWAMTSRIPVFGAASIGALRASELEQFGMMGVGRIFSAYRDGRLEDDDEVAVLHGPAELGYPLCSEAMVNIRASLALAAQWRIVGPGTARALVSLAKSLFYEDRKHSAMLHAGRSRGLPAAELDALEKWLPDHALDEKASDARQMLGAMAGHLASGTHWEPPGLRFHSTAAWRRMRRRESQRDAAARGTRPAAIETMLEELGVI